MKGRVIAFCSGYDSGLVSFYAVVVVVAVIRNPNLPDFYS